jgi:nucleotide-binding universal stress UspA family protein
VSINEILVPVDFSPASICAAHLAARIAVANGARLRLAHVLIPSSPGLVMVEPIAIPPAITARLDAGQVVAARSRLNELADELVDSLGVEIELEVSHGATVDQLLEAAAAADLVVVGTEGRTLLPQHVAVELARNGTTPVLACPVDGDRPIDRALLAIDFSATTLELASTAASLLGDATLVEIVHVHPNGVDLDVEGVNRDARWIELVAARTRTDATVRGYVGHGELAPTLLARAKEIDADLIAVGVEPANADLLFRLAEQLVTETRLPLLMVPIGS